jgi:hypothetical protein
MHAETGAALDLLRAHYQRENAEATRMLSENLTVAQREKAEQVRVFVWHFIVRRIK